MLEHEHVSGYIHKIEGGFDAHTLWFHKPDKWNVIYRSDKNKWSEVKITSYRLRKCIKYHKPFRPFKFRYNVGSETYYRDFLGGLSYWWELKLFLEPRWDKIVYKDSKE